jgi:hypothetical protein
LPTLKYARIYTGDDGLSHFEDIEVDLSDRGRGSFLSETIPSTGVAMRINSGDYDLDFHTAPRKQFVVNLSGEVEITASDGEVRRFGPGSVMLADDTTGKGHKSRATTPERVSLFVHLPE